MEKVLFCLFTPYYIRARVCVKGAEPFEPIFTVNTVIYGGKTAKA